MPYKLKSLIILTIALSVFKAVITDAQVETSYFYDVGTPSLTSLYVDPVNGDDSNDGSAESSAFKTLQAAYNVIPKGSALTTGYQVLLMPGTYTADNLPNFWEDIIGTYNYPVIVKPLSGRDSVLLTAPINGKNLHYLYLINLRIIPSPALDPLHIELGDHVLLRGLYLDGGRSYVRDNGSIVSGADFAHETLKVNQSQYIYIEDSNIGGADDNAIDFVSVQYGHIVNNKIQRAGDWCMYNKGGSAYLRVEGNEIAYCGTGGYTAGQGTGFEYMTSPWIHYEAYDIKFINNVVHHTAGAAFGVNGGYNITLAYNTAYSVGSRSHLVEFVFGTRSCDGDAEKFSNCSSYNSAGGWGSTQQTTGSDDVNPGTRDPQPIPNKNIYFYNNIIYNPSGVSAGKHFAVYLPRNPANGTNIPSPSAADNNLVIKGNIIWNGDNSTPLGIGGSEDGCQSSNATCNQSLVTSENSINIIEPQLRDPSSGDFRPTDSSNVITSQAFSVPSFAGGDRASPPSAPEGNLGNEVSIDRGNSSRTAAAPAGAYSSSQSSLTHDPAGDSVPSDGGGNGGGSNQSPQIKAPKASCVKGSKKSNCSFSAKASDSDGSISSVAVTVSAQGMNDKNVSLKLKKGAYSGSTNLAKTIKKISAQFTAIDNSGATATKVVKAKVN